MQPENFRVRGVACFFLSEICKLKEPFLGFEEELGHFFKFLFSKK